MRYVTTVTGPHFFVGLSTATTENYVILFAQRFASDGVRLGQDRAATPSPDTLAVRPNKPSV